MVETKLSSSFSKPLSGIAISPALIILVRHVFLPEQWLENLRRVGQRGRLSTLCLHAHSGRRRVSRPEQRLAFKIDSSIVIKK